MADYAAFEPVPPFDYTDMSIRLVEDAYFATQRDECPVMRSSSFGGFWALTKYADVAWAAQDHEHFSTADGPTIPSFDRPFESKPLSSDPPEHGKYRKLLQPFFTPAAVAQMEPLVRTIVVDKIKSIADRHEADLMKELGEPVPAEVMAITLGLGRERGREISFMNQSAHHSATHGDRAASAAARASMLSFLTREIESRRKSPTGDLLSTIVHSEVDGEPVTDEIRYGMATMLIVAGTDTTVSGITNALAVLAREPHFKRGLLEDSRQLDAFINESLRFDAPLLGLARTVRESVCVRGAQFEVGDRVLLLWGSGNHDPERFSDPDTFDPHRQQISNLTFGYGRHRCLGDHLAKLEIRIVIEEVLARMPDFRVASGKPLPLRNDLERGPSSLPVVW